MVAWFPATALPPASIQNCWSPSCHQRWGLDLEPAVRPQWAHPSRGDQGGRCLRVESLGWPRPQRRLSASAEPRACWGPVGQLCSCLSSLPTSTSPTARSPWPPAAGLLAFRSRSWSSLGVCVWWGATLLGLLLLTSLSPHFHTLQESVTYDFFRNGVLLIKAGV